MHSTTVAVDLAKNVFELAVADSEGKIGERLRLNRARFSSFFVHRAPCRVLMEACGSAYYWARRIGAHGHAVQLLPAQYVRQYVRRNKTDRADAAALIEAARCADIRTVPAKSLEQQSGPGSASAAQPVDEHATALPQHPSRTAARVWHRSSPWREGRARSHRLLSCTTPAGAARSDPSLAGPDAQRGQVA